ncbi:MAG: hypothetical protein E6J84_11100 [Deltaproteobacteria bacterium]|nr:MAG: hypothetical protein E6J84_11100 [Deltaproteobacteria bacterium]
MRLLHPMDLAQRADGDERRERGDGGAERIELPGRPVAASPRGLDSLRRLLRGFHVVLDEIVCRRARSVRQMPDLVTRRLLRQVAMSAPGLLQRSLGRFVERAHRAVQLADESTMSLAGKPFTVRKTRACISRTSARRSLITWMPGAASREIMTASASISRAWCWTRTVDPMKAATTPRKATARTRVEVPMAVVQHRPPPTSSHPHTKRNLADMRPPSRPP